MIKQIIGALVGREIDKRDGRGGVKGAAMGYAAGSLLRRMGPLGTVLGAAYIGKRALDRRKGRRPL